MRKTAIILGTRPEAIKLIPVYLEMKKFHNHVFLVSTGQHKEMLMQIFQFFNVNPDVELQVMRPNQTLGTLTSALFSELEKFFLDQEVEDIIVQGDTATSMVSSIMGYYHNKRVAHVEAGLRTWNKLAPFPEEVNRKIIGTVADYHFAPTVKAKNNLNTENITENVYVVGNTVIDSLNLAVRKVFDNKGYYNESLKNYFDENNKTILITGHRRESFGKGFEEICRAIKELARYYKNYLFVYPVHLNPNVRETVFNNLDNLENIKLIDPLPYDQLVYLMANSHLILTDSGGIQEEAPALNKPVIVMRETTERLEGVESGCSILAGTTAKSIYENFRKVADNLEVYNQMANAENPYGSGDSSKQIREIFWNV